MLSFKITYRAERGGVPQARIIHAKDVSEALTIMRVGQRIYSFVNVAVRCVATTRKGSLCQRYGPDTLCSLHAPMHGGR